MNHIMHAALALASVGGLATASRATAQCYGFDGAEMANAATLVAVMPIHLWVVAAQVADSRTAHPGFDAGWALGELMAGLALTTWHAAGFAWNDQCDEGPGKILHGLGFAMSLWEVVHAVLSMANVLEAQDAAMNDVRVQASGDGFALEWSAVF